MLVRGLWSRLLSANGTNELCARDPSLFLDKKTQFDDDDADVEILLSAPPPPPLAARPELPGPALAAP